MFEREQKREKFLEAKHREVKLRKAVAAVISIILPGNSHNILEQ